MNGRMAKAASDKRVDASRSVQFTQEKTSDLLTEIRATLVEHSTRLTAIEDWLAGGALLPSAQDDDEPTGVTSGAKQKLSDAVLLERRDAYVKGLERVWPSFQAKIANVKSSEDAAVLAQEIASELTISQQSKEDFVRSATKIVGSSPGTCALFEFIRSNRYVPRVSRETRRMISRWSQGDDACLRAGAKLPTRQIANALAGVPELAWRTSLDRCLKTPCWYYVAGETERHYGIVR